MLLKALFLGFRSWDWGLACVCPFLVPIFGVLWVSVTVAEWGDAQDGCVCVCVTVRERVCVFSWSPRVLLVAAECARREELLGSPHTRRGSTFSSVDTRSDPGCAC